MSKPPSVFRRFLLSKWEEHCVEVEAWEKKQPEYLVQQYFDKYKWWLKREFKHQQLVDSAIK